MATKLSYLPLGSSPANEDCVQVGTPNYMEYSRLEVERYIALLKERFPNCPVGCHFASKTFPHDFGTYREAVIFFDRDDKEAVNFAYMVEGNLPTTWPKRYHISGDFKAHLDPRTLSLEETLKVVQSLAPSNADLEKLSESIREMALGDMRCVANVGVIICVEAPWEDPTVTRSEAQG